MYCKYCGNEIVQGEKICAQCGKSVNQDETDAFMAEEGNISQNHESKANYGIASNPNLEQQTTCKELLFLKEIMGGSVGKTTKTILYVYPDFIKFQQSVKYFKEKVDEKCIKLEEIQTVVVRTTLDFLATLSGSIIVFFEFGGLLQGYFRGAFIAAIVATFVLCSGYGKEIDILMSDSSRLKIPFGDESESRSAEDFFMLVGYDKVTINQKGFIYRCVAIAIAIILCLFIDTNSEKSMFEMEDQKVTADSIQINGDQYDAGFLMHDIDNTDYEEINSEIGNSQNETEEDSVVSDFSEEFNGDRETIVQNDVQWEGNYVRTNGPAAFISVWSSEEDGVLFAVSVGVSGYAAYIDMRDLIGEWEAVDMAVYSDESGYRLSLTKMDDDSLYVSENQESYEGSLNLSGIYIREELADPSICEFVFPESNNSYLSEYDCIGLSALECRIARNEIYARYGRKFSDESLQAYFDSCVWYQGTIEPAEFSEEFLNEVELSNLNTITAYEISQGFQ